jgi:hypothetical protein
MSIVLSPDIHPRLTVRATGDLTHTDFTAFLRCERSCDRRYGPVWFDATDATTNMSAADVEQVATLLVWTVRRSGPRGPLAIIVTDDALFGLMQLLHVLCEQHGIEVRVFRADADAEHWLAKINTQWKGV